MKRDEGRSSFSPEKLLVILKLNVVEEMGLKSPNIVQEVDGTKER